MLMFSKITFQKRSKCGYYWRFPLFKFLQEKPRTVFVLHNMRVSIKFLSLSSLSVLRTIFPCKLRELNIDDFIKI